LSRVDMPKTARKEYRSMSIRYNPIRMNRIDRITLGLARMVSFVK
jgi:hypothetical protein